nr:MAG TPA: hypothetical protein [Caudoviricetes sp.]
MRLNRQIHALSGFIMNQKLKNIMTRKSSLILLFYF